MGWLISCKFDLFLLVCCFATWEEEDKAKSTFGEFFNAIFSTVLPRISTLLTTSGTFPLFLNSCDDDGRGKSASKYSCSVLFGLELLPLPLEDFFEEVTLVVVAGMLLFPPLWRFIIEFHRFFTAFSGLPGSNFAISHQRLPILSCAAISVALIKKLIFFLKRSKYIIAYSSASLQGALLTDVSK